MRPCSQILSLLLCCSACAPLARTSASTAAPVVSAPFGAIGTTELDRANTSDLFDAIATLRPSYFSTRGSTSFRNEPDAPIVVILNGRIRGGVAELRGIAVALTRSVRRLSAAEVYQMTGLSAPSGGIEVVLGR